MGMSGQNFSEGWADFPERRIETVCRRNACTGIRNDNGSSRQYDILSLQAFSPRGSGRKNQQCLCLTERRFSAATGKGSYAGGEGTRDMF